MLSCQRGLRTDQRLKPVFQMPRDYSLGLLGCFCRLCNRLFEGNICSGYVDYRLNICCPRDCVSRHNGGTSGAPLKPLRVDSALRALSSLMGLRGAPEVPPLCRETQSLGQQMLELCNFHGVAFFDGNCRGIDGVRRNISPFKIRTLTDNNFCDLLKSNKI